MTLKPDSGYHIPVMRGATKSKKKKNVTKVPITGTKCPNVKKCFSLF